MSTNVLIAYDFGYNNWAFSEVVIICSKISGICLVKSIWSRMFARIRLVESKLSNMIDLILLIKYKLSQMIAGMQLFQPDRSSK